MTTTTKDNNDDTLERWLMQQCGIRHSTAEQITSLARKNLGLSASSPVTAELEAECLRLHRSQDGVVMSLQVEDVFSSLVENDVEEDTVIPNKKNARLNPLAKQEDNLTSTSTVSSSHFAEFNSPQNARQHERLPSDASFNSMPSLDSYYASSDCSYSSSLHSSSSHQHRSLSLQAGWDSVKSYWSSTSRHNNKAAVNHHASLSESSFSESDMADFRITAAVPNTNQEEQQQQQQQQQQPQPRIPTSIGGFTKPASVAKREKNVSVIPESEDSDAESDNNHHTTDRHHQFSPSLTNILFPPGAAHPPHVQCDNAAQHAIPVSDWPSRWLDGFHRVVTRSVSKFL